MGVLLSGLLDGTETLEFPLFGQRGNPRDGHSLPRESATASGKLVEPEDGATIHTLTPLRGDLNSFGGLVQKLAVVSQRDSLPPQPAAPQVDITA